MEIAALLDNNGFTSSFEKDGIIKVYSKVETGFKVIKEIPYSIKDAKSTNEIRSKIISSIEAIKNCRLFAACEVKGIPYAILEGMKFTIWKVNGIPDNFLQYIYDKEKELMAAKEIEESIPKPIEKSRPGSFYIDLEKAMENNSGYSSKKILLPFLRETNFTELEIDCGHVPPWFENEFKALKFKAEKKQIAVDRFKVIVYSNPSVI
ncbi:MAG: Fe-only nitrogenase accessory AnfO family protein [Bacillota bacterium]|nr:Fe-only nitrogenase accessory AnfO family protein [Bacillota bacterium]